MSRQVCPGCREGAPNACNPGSLCDDCMDEVSEAACDQEMAELDNEPEYRTCRRCGSGPMMIAVNDDRCRFCRAAEVRAASLAIAHGAATVAVEDEIDEREDRANDRAEREEEREAAEAEWAAEQGEEITVEVTW